MKILLIIPAFDEEPAIVALVSSAKKHIPDTMVIDNGSNDATTLVAALAGAMVHRLKTNVGKGEALKTGFAFAIEQGYDWIFTMDGDGQHNPDDIPAFLSLLEVYDLILGNRLSEARGLPFFPRLANHACSLIVSIICGRRIHDSQNGFRAYSAHLLRSIRLQLSHYDLETEVVIKAARKGFRIGETRIEAIYTGEKSRFKWFKDSIRFLAVIPRSFLWW